MRHGVDMLGAMAQSITMAKTETVTAYRATAWDADDTAAHGRWWASDPIACADCVTTLYGGYADDCRMYRAEIDTAGMAEIDTAGMLYTPEAEAAWVTAATDRGAVIRNCQMTDGGDPCDIWYFVDADGIEPVAMATDEWWTE